MSSQFDAMAYTVPHSSSSSFFREDSVDHNKPVEELKSTEPSSVSIAESEEETALTKSTVDTSKDSDERTSLEVSLTRLKSEKPPPIATGISVMSSISSIDSPQSPFFIPRNPFLSLVGKMPKFQWTVLHLNLLEGLLKSLKLIIDRWKQ